jgi:hypothetical protein
VFEGLKGKDGGADVAGLVVPNEFDLALLGLGEVVVFGGGARYIEGGKC